MPATRSARADYSILRVFASPGQPVVVLDNKREKVPGIISVDISLRAAQPPLMRVNMLCGHFDVVGTPVFAVADPVTGLPKPVKRIEFSDGTVFDAPPLPQVDPAPAAAEAAPAAPKANGADQA